MSAAAVHQLRGEIEGPRPLRAPQGRIAVEGWCLLLGQPAAPPVRLVTPQAILPMTTRVVRTDVPRLFPGQRAAANCGFTITGELPEGVCLARFEAQHPDGRWHVFKTLSLLVTPPGLLHAIEAPFAVGTIRQRVHVEGWALHPSRPLRSLTLRYGHQEIPCQLGVRRTDVPRIHPTVPHAGEAGFASKVILSAGVGPLRLKAALADGTVTIVPTGLQVNVRTDENTSAAIDLTVPRQGLPDAVTPIALPPPERTTRPLNLLFVLHGHFTSNSTLQAAALANELARAGHECRIAVPRDMATFAYHRDPLFHPLLHEDAVATGGGFSGNRGPDIVHAWTTREEIRRTCTELRRRHGGKLVVQLEDNEQEILAHNLARPWAELQRLAPDELDRLVPAGFTHPLRGREFLESADGVTVIVDSLRRFVPDGKPCATIWPAADARYFHPRPIPQEFRRALQLPEATTLLFYPGNAHAANATEMHALYAAVAQLNRTGHPTRLIRTGIDQVDFLGPLSTEVRPWILHLGLINAPRHLPALMALADVFVQPGVPDAFNDCRFPSKLPEFFSIGRPVVLPRTNLGLTTRHGIDAYVLDRADADGIARAIVELRNDRALAARLGQGAVDFARKHFDWRRSAETLAKFYSTLTT